MTTGRRSACRHNGRRSQSGVEANGLNRPDYKNRRGMKPGLTIGLTGELTWVVDPTMTISLGEQFQATVFSTPAMIMLMERAARERVPSSTTARNPWGLKCMLSMSERPY